MQVYVYIYIHIHTGMCVCIYIYLYMYIHVYMQMSLPCSKKGIAFWEAYRKPSQKMTEEQICLRNGRGKEKESMRKGREKERQKKRKGKGQFFIPQQCWAYPHYFPLIDPYCRCWKVHLASAINGLPGMSGSKIFNKLKLRRCSFDSNTCLRTPQG